MGESRHRSLESGLYYSFDPQLRETYGIIMHDIDSILTGSLEGMVTSVVMKGWLAAASRWLNQSIIGDPVVRVNVQSCSHLLPITTLSYMGMEDPLSLATICFTGVSLYYCIIVSHFYLHFYLFTSYFPPWILAQHYDSDYQGNVNMCTH